MAKKKPAPRVEDFEKLGVFYLGKRYDLETDELTDELTLYDSKDLTTHGVIIGMARWSGEAVQWPDGHHPAGSSSEAQAASPAPWPRTTRAQHHSRTSSTCPRLWGPMYASAHHNDAHR